MIIKRNGNGQTECTSCKEKGKWALSWDNFLYTYNDKPYCYECLVEMLKEFANDLGYNIIKKKNIPKMLCCTCGCNRRTHWYNSKNDTRILECKKCGKEVEGKNDIDVIYRWNSEILKGDE